MVADDVSQQQEQKQQQNNKHTLGGSRKRWTPAGAASATVAAPHSGKRLRDSPYRELADTSVGDAALRAADSNVFEESASEDGMCTAVCHHLTRCSYTFHLFPLLHSTALHHICCLQFALTGACNAQREFILVFNAGVDDRSNSFLSPLARYDCGVAQHGMCR